ncbi:MAG: RNA polymerase III subunit C82 [Caeruleum heppii]|nr:MAG: RNA polymerase III subunit C82 [Caeruleum heppii]
MSQNVADLCTLLVHDIYGELCSRVFSVLMRLGRLTLPSLAQHVQLPNRLLKNGLAVLIQQHLVLHHTPRTHNAITSYEADWESAYFLIRAGRVIGLAGDRFGDAAAGALSNLLQQGHASIDDMMEAYSVALGRAGDRSAEGAAEQSSTGIIEGNMGARPADGSTSVTRLEDLRAALQSLLGAGLISEVSEERFRPLADSFNQAEELHKNGPLGASGTKAKALLVMNVLKTVREWRHGSPAGQGSSSGGNARLKRALDDEDDLPVSAHAKRRKMISNGTQVNGCHEISGPLDGDVALDVTDNLVVRVDLEKCIVTLRNEELVAVAERKLGFPTASIYAALLRLVGDKIPYCHDSLADVDAEEDSTQGPVVTTQEVCLALDKSSEHAAHSAINEETGGSAMKRRKRISISLDKDERLDVPLVEEDREDHLGCGSGRIDTEGIEDPNDPDRRDAEAEVLPKPKDPMRDRTTRYTQVRKHLRLLAEDPSRFIKQLSRDHSSFNAESDTWVVDFASLIKWLRQSELETIITARFGPLGTRAVSILLDKGKLDEKQISNLALVKQKEIRSLLTAMHEAGFLQLQEVPRDNSRAPSRTIFLWYYDPETCRQLVLEDLYKTMTRLLQRIGVEKEGLRMLIEKAERTDVRGHEDVYLSLQERDALQRWRETEERLLGQVGRLDRMVGILRDF